MAMEPAAISAIPATTTRRLLSMAPEMPAAKAKGTVRPSDIPMTTSRTTSPAVKWRSMWGVWGMISKLGMDFQVVQCAHGHLTLTFVAEFQRGLVQGKPESVLHLDAHRRRDVP